MRNYIAIYLFLFSLLLPTLTCAENNVTSPQTLSHTHWQLQTLLNEEVNGTAMQREMYLHFSDLKETQGEFKGGSGCNDILGKYVATKITLSFDSDHIAMTRMACPHMDVEKKFLQTLKLTNSWKIENENLELFDANETSIAEFKAIIKKEG